MARRDGEVPLPGHSPIRAHEIPGRCTSETRRWRQNGRGQLDRLGLEGRLELAIQRAEREGPEDWQEAATRLVMEPGRVPVSASRRSRPFAVSEP